MRIRPPNKVEEDGGSVIQKLSNDSLSIAGQTFTFDSVADIESTQARFYCLIIIMCMQIVNQNIINKIVKLYLEYYLFQIDIFQLIGAPLVENCLAGFNSSVFAYGQVFLFPFMNFTA